jgi:uncharacterized membrane protein
MDFEFGLTKVAVSLPVGIATSYLLLVSSLGVENANNLLFYSIICTLGFGLIIWISIFWLIGIAVVLIITLIIKIFATGSSNNSSEIVTRVQPIKQDVIALSSYIQRSRSHGASDTQIISRLQEKNWTEVDIQQAFQYLSTQSNQSTRS